MTELSLPARIAQMYGLAYTSIAAPQNGYRNYSYRIGLPGNQALNLIVYKNEPGMLARITRTNQVANFAASHGLPARRTFDPRILALRAAHGTRYAGLYYYLPGATIPWEAYTMNHIKALGKAMSDLHAVLQMYPGELPSVAAESTQLNARMVRYFADPHVITALRQKLGLAVVRADFQKLLHGCRHLPNQHALHMDFVRGNMLFNGSTITGILDFEKTGRGHPLLDIARTLAFLLVDCKYKPEPKVRKYFLQSGYQKRGAASLPNSPRLLEELINFFLLHDFYKFLRHNPYEYLPQNQHFIRTKAFLLKRHILLAH